MNTNQRSTLRSVLIAIAFGIVCAVIIGFISGTYKLPIGVTIPIIIAVTFGIFLFLRKGRDDK